MSAWALAEIGYAAGKTSNPLTADHRAAILAELAAPDSPFEVLPADAETARRPRRHEALVLAEIVEVGSEVIGVNPRLREHVDNGKLTAGHQSFHGRPADPQPEATPS